MGVKVKQKNVPYKLPKDMSPEESELLNRLLADNVAASPERKRPRNPVEKRVLNEWEDERSGEKIGEI
ncbi:hypothetical protein SAMN04488102_102202 [Alkalibacterium subtropicum]|uniref:Uncharacterized protein n=1 Tax=Alkalibacterium subtropicum TaxID=753702 RepID=A0A1I1FX08_9LACT|nr:hypothetical protein [Alkalibacterium subtropicum]SFC01520.1 hypothetical protein SAMN04488102_102202 [Alkalibacterium subtropicum]